MQIAVIGGGISGLTAAYRLASKGQDVVLFEREESPGGLAGALDLCGHVVDRYYRHIFKTDSPLIGLVEELGLSDEFLWLPTKIGFYAGGEIYPFGTPVDLLRFSPLTPLDRLRFGLGVFYLTKKEDWSDLEKLSAKEWITKWMGRSSYEKVWAPLLRLKFGKACDEVSAAWIWGRIHPRAKSRSKGMKTEELGYMKGSYQVLMDALADRIGALGGELRFGKEVTEIKPMGGRWSVETVDSVFSADTVLSTVPLPVLIQIAPDLPDQIKLDYGAIDYEAVTCLSLKIERSLSDIYWMNIIEPGIRFAGLIEHTNFIPRSLYGDKHIVYLFQYLESDHPDFSLDAQSTFEAYLPSLRTMFPAFREEDVIGMALAKDTYATPIYAKGYSQRKPDIVTPLESLYIATTSQIYPEDRNMSNGVSLAEEAARLVLEKGSSS